MSCPLSGLKSCDRISHPLSTPPRTAMASFLSGFSSCRTATLSSTPPSSVLWLLMLPPGPSTTPTPNLAEPNPTAHVLSSSSKKRWGNPVWPPHSPHGSFASGSYCPISHPLLRSKLLKLSGPSKCGPQTSSISVVPWGLWEAHRWPQSRLSESPSAFPEGPRWLLCSRKSASTAPPSSSSPLTASADYSSPVIVPSCRLF